MSGHQGDFYFWRGSLKGIKRLVLILATFSILRENKLNELSNGLIIVKRWKQVYFVYVGFLTRMWLAKTCNDAAKICLI